MGVSQDWSDGAGRWFDGKGKILQITVAVRPNRPATASRDCGIIVFLASWILAECVHFWRNSHDFPLDESNDDGAEQP
jgi:hypothetical protein